MNTKKNSNKKVGTKNTIKTVNTNGKLIMYSGSRGQIELKADTDKDTIWATQAQIAELFDVQKAAISKHINNIFDSAELKRNSTVSILETVQIEGNRPINRKIEYFNLDMIIAVGYRVNSKKATQFRIWATKTLKEYLIKGTVINNDRIKSLPDKMLADISSKIDFIQRTIKSKSLDKGEVDSLLSVIHDYANSWKFLKEFDEGELKLKKSTEKESSRLEYDFVRTSIDRLKLELMSKGEASDIFGNERDGSFQGILKTIYQTFDGKELYASLNEKASHLLYFVIKDHPFSDGNKRIGSFLFVYFLQINGILFRKNGERKINDNTLVALALLIAESDPKDKEQMIALTTNLLI